jgi:hypothetical protein
MTLPALRGGRFASVRHHPFEITRSGDFVGGAQRVMMQWARLPARSDPLATAPRIASPLRGSCSPAGEATGARSRGVVATSTPVVASRHPAFLGVVVPAPAVERAMVAIGARMAGMIAISVRPDAAEELRAL